MKRIALFVPSLKNGGAERVVSIWSSELSKLRDEVYLIVLYKTEGEYEIYGDVKKIYLYESYTQSKSYTLLSKIKKIRSVLKENRIDILLPFIEHIGVLSSAASFCSKTHIVETIRIDPFRSPESVFVRALRDMSVKMAKCCIVQNEEQKKYFSKRVQKKMEIFPNPLHPSIAQIIKEYKTSFPLTFMTAGRLEKQKNHKLLCDSFALAVKENPEIELKIYGVGSMKDELQQHIESLGMQYKIRLCGRTDNIAETLAQADAFILSSNYEGMPNSLLEAMAAGLPCISTDCPTGPSDMIVSGENGILVPVGDTESMAAAIKKIAEDYTAAIEMGKKARAFVLENYEASASAKRLLEFVEKI